MCLAHWKKIIFILTSGLAQRLQALVRLLRSKKSQRSIICGLLKVPRKGFEVFVVIVVYIVYMQRRTNLPSRCSEGQKEVGNRNFSTGIELGEEM